MCNTALQGLGLVSHRRRMLMSCRVGHPSNVPFEEVLFLTPVLLLWRLVTCADLDVWDGVAWGVGGAYYIGTRASPVAVSLHALMWSCGGVRGACLCWHTPQHQHTSRQYHQTCTTRVKKLHARFGREPAKDRGSFFPFRQEQFCHSGVLAG